MKTAKTVFEFEWDKGNIDKNKEKHGIGNQEAEEVFFDEQKVIFKDSIHTSNKEVRFILLGKTKLNRFLFIVFTKRGKKIRIISARDINNKERYLYEEKA